jgi:hypothetical protein
MGKTRPTLLMLSAVALIVPLAGAAPAYADATTGSISGQLSTAGVVRTDVWASLYTSTSGWLGATRVDETGTFHFTDLAPGDYEVQFLWNNTLTQWYRGKRLNETPDTVTVVAGQDAVVDDSTLPTGTITGTLTDADGNPMPQVEAYASAVDNSGGAAFGFTDASGHYSIEALTGDYHLSFAPTGYPTDYVPHSPSPTGASVFTVNAGQALAVDEQLPPTGSVSGRYTTAGGQPLAHAFVYLLTADGNGGASVQTGDDGSYQFPHAYAGGYKVEFVNPDFSSVQYAVGKLTIDAADVFTVTAGADTAVNDSQLPVGTITVTATDSVTHQPIANFCAGADGQSSCGNGSGTVTITNVRQGNQSLYVYTDDAHYFGVNGQAVAVTGGQDTSVAVSLRPGATINTVITDAATGAPVPNACVSALGGSRTMIPDFAPYCSDEQGNVHIGPLEADAYRLYVSPPEPYGLQFVGPAGGVGSPEKARRTSVTVGATVTVPAIRLDHAGTVTGTVTDGSGHPLSNAFVTSSAFEPGPGPAGAAAVTDSNGHYTLTRLGPYQWPLLFIANNLPQQWSGGVPDRTKASTVRVVRDGTSTYNEKMVTGITVSGNVSAGGAPAGAGRVIAYNTATGEVIGVAEVDQGTYRLPVLGSQTIRLRYETYVDGGPEGWFGGTDYAHATSIGLHKKDMTLNLAVG